MGMCVDVCVTFMSRGLQVLWRTRMYPIDCVFVHVCLCLCRHWLGVVSKCVCMCVCGCVCVTKDASRLL